MSNKQTIRSSMRALRKALSLSEDDYNALLANINQTIEPDQRAALYWPAGAELDTRSLIKDLAKQGLQILLPIVEDDTQLLSFAPYGSDTALIEGAYGASVPDTNKRVEPDILIVPLVAFDKTGTRLGQGGGYYDATITHYRAQKGIKVIGLAYAQQEWQDGIIPTEPHDEKLDWVITPLEARKFDI